MTKRNLKRGAITLASVVVLAITFRSAAKDIYASQSASGNADGSVAVNAYPLTWLNTTANWNNGTNTIQPGDTVHLVGTFTSGLAIQGSGAPGNPITIYFEPGAQFVAPYWTKAIDLNSRSYIVIDGGVGGLIAATDNGTLLGNQKDTIGISGGLSTGNNVEIRNLIISNLFYKVVLTNGDPRNLQPTIRAIFLGFNGATSISVHNNTLIQAGNAITFNFGGNCANVSAVSNIISDVSFGVFLNCNAGGFSSGFAVSHNICTNLSTYDGDWGFGSGDHNHNNFLIVNSTAAATNYGLTIEGNLAGEKCGKYMTSLIKVTPDYDTFWGARIVNNVLVNTDTNAVISNGSISGNRFLVANNTIVNEGGGVADAGIKVAGASVQIYNNLFKGVSMNIIDQLSATGTNQGVTASDYNVLRGDLGDSAFYGHNGNTFQTLSDWKSSTGYDTHSKIGVLSLSPSYVPLSTDTVAIGAGMNLTILGITNDFYGNPRPATGPWTIGAFEVPGTSTSISPPNVHTPTGR
jgi:hypothetical protein